MRFEYLYPTSRYNYMQWFINCALVDLLSPPGTVAGRPTGFAKHPGAYKVDDPGECSWSWWKARERQGLMGCDVGANEVSRHLGAV